MRIYYNDLFAGQAPVIIDDYLEDHVDNIHIVGKTLEGSFYRGFIADIYFRNFSTTTFSSLTQLPKDGCTTCE